MKRSRDGMSEDEGGAESDGGEGSDDDIEDDTVPGYDASRESLPPSKVFTPEFKDMLTEIQKITGLLLEPIASCSNRSAVTEGLHEEIARRTKGDYPEEVRIAIVGAMKSGKSSLVNSLLSVGMIARQGDPGKSCTWVVNEFRFLLPHQAKTFAADVYFFTQEERHEIIRGMVASYYRASAKDSSELEEPKDGQQTTEDYNTQKDVVTACMALFAGQKEFESVTKAHTFLSTAESEDDDEIVDKLIVWADRRMNSILSGQPCVRLEASTTQKLLLVLGPYQYTVKTHYRENVASMWPFVNHIKFGLECELLRNNLSLVDLPGLSDANKIRVQNATDHLRNCTHEMLVADISRAGDDNFIRDRFQDSVMLRGWGRTILVLTRGDTMDENTEIHGNAKDARAFEKLADDTVKLEKKINEMSSRIKKGGPEKQQWKKAKLQLSKELEHMEMTEFKMKLAIRTRDTKTEMRQLYSEITQDTNELNVFCVGNENYKRHQSGYKKDKSPPILSVEETEIPGLRQHLFLAPAEGKLQEARHLALTQLSVAIKCANLFVSKTHLARKDDIERMVLEPQAKIAPIVDAAIDWMKVKAEEELLHPMILEDSEWSKQARKLCKEWIQTHGNNMHLNFLKKDGVKKGKGKGATAISWNSELIDIKLVEIEEWFGKFITYLEEVKKNIIRAVNSHVLKMISDISADEQFTLMALKSFVDYVREERPNLKACVEKGMRSLRKELSNIYGTATSEEPSNQIVRAMAPIYAKAREIKGKTHGGRNAPQVRVNFFNKQVTKQGDGVWMRAHEYLKKDIHKVLDRHARELKHDILAFFVGVDEKFKMMSADKDKENPEETAVREALQKNVIVAAEKYEQELLPAAEAFFEVHKTSLFVEQ